MELLSSLSDEVVFHILSLLPASDVVSVSQTSKRLFSLCRDLVLWKFIVKRDFGAWSRLAWPCFERIELEPGTKTRKRRFRHEPYSKYDSTHLVRLINLAIFSRTAQKTVSESSFLTPCYGSFIYHCFNRIFSVDTEFSALEYPQIVQSSIEPSPREGHAMAAIDNYWFMVGGFLTDIEFWVTDLLDYPNLRWMRPDTKHIADKKMPTSVVMWPRYGHSLTAVGEKLLVLFGGMTAGGYRGEVNELYYFHLEDPAPTKHPHMNQELPFCLRREDVSALGEPPLERAYHSATWVRTPTGRDLIYIYGGISRHRSISDVRVLDVQARAWLPPHWVLDTENRGFLPDSWLECPEPAPRFGHSATLIQDRYLYILGGGTGYDLLRSGHDFADVHVLDTYTMRWFSRSEPIEMPQHGLGRCHSSCLIGRQIVCYGGGIETCNHLVSFNLDTNTYRFIQHLSIPRLSHAMTFYPPLILIWGGWQPDLGGVSELCVLDLLRNVEQVDTNPPISTSVILHPA